MKVIDFIIKSIFSFALSKFFAAICLLLSFTPEEWIASLFNNPPAYIAEWFKLGLFILALLIFITPYVTIWIGRKASVRVGTELIYQDDHELTFAEISERWSDCANPKDGFSSIQIMTQLLRAIWIGKLKDNLTFNYLRANTQPLLRQYEIIPTRVMLAFVLAHFWDRKTEFFTKEEMSCFSLLEAEKRGETRASQHQKYIEDRFKALKTWERLGSLNYSQFSQPGTKVLESGYFEPICVKRAVFKNWLQKSKVRLPENW